MTIAFLVIYVVLLLGVSFWLGSRAKSGDFAMDARSVGAFGVFASTFTLIGAGEFLTVAALAFVNDGAAVALLAGYGIGMVLLGVFSHVARRQSGDRHYLSLPDFFYDRFGRAAGAIANLLTIAAFFALLVLQLFAGALMLAEITPLSPWLGAFLSAAVVATYLLFAGFGGVILTDKIQFVLMLVGLPTLAFAVLPSPGDFLKVVELDFGPLSTAAVLLTGILVIIGSGDVWQRLYAAKSTRAARVGMTAAGLGFAVYGVILASIGIAARETGITDDPNSAFLAVVLAREQGLVTSLVVLAVFSAMLSTADTEVFLISTLLENERRRWLLRDETESRDPSATPIRYLIPVVAVAGAVAGLFAESLVSIYEMLLYALLALSPLVIVGSFRELTARNATIVLLLGTASLITVVALPQVSLDYAVLVVVPGLLWGLLASRPLDDATK